MPGRSDYSSDVEGGAPVRLRFAISGRMHVPEYLDFLLDRARWLDISGWARSTGAGRVTMVAQGPEALVGALEMAAILGPLNAMVEEIDVVADPEPVAAGFVLLS